MINLRIDPSYKKELLTKEIEKCILATLSKMNLDADISIVFTSDEKVKKYNLEYRGLDSPTDVLSFEANITDPDSGRIYLGDIIISVDRVIDQAKKYNASTHEEVCLLIVHGILHLVGYDHHTTQDKEIMWALQSSILTDIGLSVRENIDQEL